MKTYGNIRLCAIALIIMMAVSCAVAQKNSTELTECLDADRLENVNIHMLDLFIQRNIPGLHVSGHNSSVCQGEPASMLGVTVDEAVNHYSKKKYIKSESVKEPELYYDNKKADAINHNPEATLEVAIDSKPCDSDVIHEPEESDNKAIFETRFDIAFGIAESGIDLSLGRNAEEFIRITEKLTDMVYVLDSVIVMASCSPDGLFTSNCKLAESRGKAIMEYLKDFADVKFILHSNSENWALLDSLVGNDTHLTFDQKREYIDICEITDPDEREAALARTDFYQYLRDNLYPELRTVGLVFYLRER